MTPLVSVITIFLDAERFLDEAVESVLAQDHPSWELLLVDDGSTDRSGAIARGWAARHPDRVRYLTSSSGAARRGMSAARNVGIAHARGSLLAFLDADDVWLPHKLTVQVALAGDHPEVGMVCGPTQYWHSWRRDADASDELREIGVPGDTVVQPPQLLTGMLREQVNAPATCTALLRRETVEGVGGFEESFRDMFEDRAFFAKVYRTVPVYLASSCHDRYRQHDASASARAVRAGTFHPAELSPSHRAFLEWVAGYLRGVGERRPEVLAAMEAALWPYRHPARARVRRWVHGGRVRASRWRRLVLGSRRPAPSREAG